MKTIARLTITLFLWMAFLNAATGSQAREEKKLSTAPLAIDAPVWTPEVEWHGLRNNKAYKYWLVGENNDVYAWNDTHGKNDRECTSTTYDDLFAPSLTWKDCRGYADGTQKVQKKGGPWPLKIGKKWSYKIKGKDTTGESWKTTRQCKVTSAVAIEIGLGSSHTFKVICKDSWRVYTYYISALDSFLVYMRSEKKDGTKGTTFERTQLTGVGG